MAQILSIFILEFLELHNNKYSMLYQIIHIKFYITSVFSFKVSLVFLYCMYDIIYYTIWTEIILIFLVLNFLNYYEF